MSDYNFKLYNRKKQQSRIKLGAKQMVIYPVLNFLWLVPVISIFLLDQLKKAYLTVFSVAEILQPIFEFSLTFAIVIISISLIILILQMVGEIFARKDELNIAMCFNKKQLENGNPILISKRYGKNKKIIMKTFHTYIPIHIWRERQQYIDDIFNVRTISIEYGKRANTIVLTTVKGRKSNVEEIIYDETI